MPPSSELCDIPNCDGTAVTSSIPRLDSRRQVRPRDHVDRVDTFREGPVISLATNLTDNDVITPAPFYSFTAAGGWLYTEWSEVRITINYKCRDAMLITLLSLLRKSG